jgi:hypothetical protein
MVMVTKVYKPNFKLGKQMVMVTKVYKPNFKLMVEELE